MGVSVCLGGCTCVPQHALNFSQFIQYSSKGTHHNRGQGGGDGQKEFKCPSVIGSNTR